MKVSQLMSTPVVTVGMDDRLDEVYRIFSHAHFHHVLVVNGKRLEGIVSDRDLFKALSPRIGTAMANDRDNASLNKRVHQIMSRKLVVINQHQSVLQAVRLFNANSISCLPVVDDEHQWVGILSWRDIFKQIEAVKDKH